LREAARRLCGSGCLLLTIIAPLSAQSLAARPPPASEMSVLLRQIAAELAAIREELRQQRARSQEETVAALEAELRQVRADRQRLEQRAERDRNGELAELEELLQQPDLDPQTVNALSTSRDALAAAWPVADGAERAAIVERERLLVERLDRERRKADRPASAAEPGRPTAPSRF
jgi:hypothetical protein